MAYRIQLSDKAVEHIKEWRLSGDVASIRKIHVLLQELSEHPRTGTGQVEALRGNLTGYWSRRINKKDRLIYTINDEIVVVTIVAMKGHY